MTAVKPVCVCMGHRPVVSGTIVQGRCTPPSMESVNCVNLTQTLSTNDSGSDIVPQHSTTLAYWTALSVELYRLALARFDQWTSWYLPQWYLVRMLEWLAWLGSAWLVWLGWAGLVLLGWVCLAWLGWACLAWLGWAGFVLLGWAGLGLEG